MRPVTIIGGGLAGLWLGIRLRDHGVSVSILEAGEYPRHRVCGEFISGRGAELLERFELPPGQLHRGRSCAFFGSKAQFFRELSSASLHISRHVLDASLAAQFQARGGILRLKERWRDSAPLEEGMIRATGRRPTAKVGKWRYVGLKVHAKNVSLKADLEMHLFANGYVGLCQLANGEVNICGMFRSNTADRALGDWKTLLSGPIGSRLNERTVHAEFLDETFCSVAGLRVQSRLNCEPNLSIGDSLAMISPLAGNGMSLALESAEAVLKPVLSFCRGEMAWSETTMAAARIHERFLRTRLRWAFVLESLLFRPVWREILLVIGSRSPGLFDLCFRQTRT